MWLKVCLIVYFFSMFCFCLFGIQHDTNVVSAVAEEAAPKTAQVVLNAEQVVEALQAIPEVYGKDIFLLVLFTVVR